jgi:Domain of unknown function (DUF4214)
MNTVSPPSIPIKPARSLQELLAHHDESFVYCAYATLLGRLPDAIGLEYYVNRVRVGHSKKHLLAQIYLSRKCQERIKNNAKLATALSAYKWLSYPLIGVTICRLGFWIDHSEVQNQLRALDNQIYRLSREGAQRAEHIQNDILVSIKDIVTNSARQKTPEDSENLRAEKALYDFELVRARSLTPRATQIYDQLKKLTLNKNKKAA